MSEEKEKISEPVPAREAAKQLPRVILLGAGASKEAGVPTAAELVPEVRERLRRNKDAWSVIGAALDATIGGLQQRQAIGGNPFGPIDVEILFAALESLAERNDSMLGPFVSTWSGAVTAAETPELSSAAKTVARSLASDVAAIASTVEGSLRMGRGPSTASYQFPELERTLQVLLAGLAEGKQKPYAAAAEMVLAVVRRMCWVTDPNMIGYVLPLVKSAVGRPLWIATLNYDNVVEMAAAQAGVTVDLGLSGTNSSVSFTGDAPIALAKLHGSGNWSRPTPWEIRIDDGPRVDSAMIFGAGNKLKVEGPYLDLLLAFRSTLSRITEVEICGYSFRDEHVNHTLIRWMALNDMCRMKAYGLGLTVDGVIESLNDNLGINLHGQSKAILERNWIRQRLTVENAKASEWMGR